ncbi:hypothetical protein HELRODRAFT_176879 [Helobdella robusta]|uniref:Uncharacterized protein n=1 Tax=Helobdella robusta TaxID=6412 RepID=T1FB00_HELRO|nr:hypothetical protein HELRODRAFT_176879 [Helobdella robusta]ESN98411.1 hypothetical protein HELRODRAFT_176879 [Helobdella robusta]
MSGHRIHQYLSMLHVQRFNSPNFQYNWTHPLHLSNQDDAPGLFIMTVKWLEELLSTCCHYLSAKQSVPVPQNVKPLNGFLLILLEHNVIRSHLQIRRPMLFLELLTMFAQGLLFTDTICDIPSHVPDFFIITCNCSAGIFSPQQVAVE